MGVEGNKMGRIIRVKINWTGFVGSPGYTNLHFEPTNEADPWSQPMVDAAVAKVQAWLVAQRPYLPAVVTTGIDPQIAELDEQSGRIEAFWTVVPAASAPGTFNGNYSAASGYCISWSTGGVWNGRRIRGRTFVVPLGSNALATDGTIDTGALVDFRARAVTLTSPDNNTRLVVWRRPTNEVIPDGGAYAVTGSTVRDKVAMLTSRRD